MIHIEIALRKKKLAHTSTCTCMYAVSVLFSNCTYCTYVLLSDKNLDSIKKVLVFACTVYAVIYIS